LDIGIRAAKLDDCCLSRIALFPHRAKDSRDMTDRRRRALRARIAADQTGVDVAAIVRERARSLGVLGWVRGDAPAGEPVGVHAEGDADAVAALIDAVGAEPGVASIESEAVKVEGHEQFAVRGVSAGAFVVQEHQATAHHYDLRLEVDGVMRSWAVPKGPSLDPAVKRLAVQVGDHDLAHNTFEGPTGGGGVIVWDRGTYEQGGRVPWPEAIDRGHAVFVLHGEKLRGGFALQRTRPGDQVGDRDPHASHSDLKPQWLLVKRRDDEARAGSEITAERPESVASGRTLNEVSGEGPAGDPR
jgi:DNA ligase D-like protein (predicted 3'-phosphoesterase)